MKKTNKKKILLLGYVDGIGGAQTAFRQMYDFVKQEGYTVKVILLADHKENLNFYNDNLLEKIIYKGSGFGFFIKKLFKLIIARKKAIKYNPEIFVSVGLSNTANFISKKLHNNCYKIAQDYIADRHKDDKIWKSSLNAFNSLAVQSPSMLIPWIKAGIPPTKINWLPCFPEKPVPGILRTQFRKKTNYIKLGYFGRLASNKGLSLLIQSLADTRINSNVTLELWGKGEQEDKLRALARELVIENRVNFLGAYPTKEEGAKLMAEYDALVLTSTEKEGLPLILLEAMAYGIPFLATNVGAIKDCCANNPDAILVQPTLEEVTIGLYNLIEGIEKNEFNAYRQSNFYEKNFSYKVMSNRWRNCFQNPERFFYEQK